MKKLLLTPLRLFSKINLKRNNSLLILFFLVYSIHLSGQIAQIHFNQNPDQNFTFSISLENHEKLKANLDRGCSSQFSIQWSLIRKESESVIISMDDVIEEGSSVYWGKKDSFTNNYTIENEEGNTEYYQSFDDFLNNYLSRSITPLKEVYKITHEIPSKIKIRGILIQRIYVKPFTIFQFVDRGNRIESEWVSLDLE